MELTDIIFGLCIILISCKELFNGYVYRQTEKWVDLSLKVNLWDRHSPSNFEKIRKKLRNFEKLKKVMYCLNCCTVIPLNNFKLFSVVKLPSHWLSLRHSHLLPKIQNHSSRRESCYSDSKYWTEGLVHSRYGLFQWVITTSVHITFISLFFFYNTSLLCSLGLPRTNNLAKDVLKLLISLLQLRMAVIKAWTVHLALQINVSSFSFLPSQADLFHCAHISHSHMLTIIGFLRQGHKGNMHMHTVAILTNSTQRERVGEIGQITYSLSWL